MSRIATTIGPSDNGRRMTLDEFEPAEAQEGHLYELGRGVIVVTDVPKRRHTAQLFAITCQFHGYHAAHPGRIALIATGSECKILLEDLQSERHPDLAIYKTPPPEEEEDFWNQWIPEIVVEVVSPSSRHRDYVEKREEYLAFGVREYWIFDADKSEMLVLRRSRGQWAERVVRPPDVYRSRLLPGFEFASGPVFEAARAAEG